MQELYDRNKEADDLTDHEKENLKSGKIEEFKFREQTIHSIHPKWLEHSINKSLAKLNVQTIDCVYLAEPLEMGMKHWKGDFKEVNMRIGHAFSFLEEMVQEGKIKSYGI